MPPSKKKATGKGAHASQNRRTGIASASTGSNNSITVASITVSRDASDTSPRPSSPTSSTSIPEEEEEEEEDEEDEEEPIQSHHPEPEVSEGEREPEQHQDLTQNQTLEPTRHPAQNHDMENANGVKAGSSSGPSTNSRPLPVAPDSDPINLNAYPYPLGVDSAVLIPPARTGYGKANLDEIEVRQRTEDIKAYHYDLNWLRAQLDKDNLTPQESRTFQLRTLDVSHQIRHCQHRIETLQATMRGKPLRGAHGATSSLNANPISSSKPAIKSTNTGVSTPSGPAHNSKRPLEFDTANDVEEVRTNGTASVKRPKIQLDQSSDHDHNASVIPEGEEDRALILQRLGEWRCSLCLSPKYLTAPPPRSPAMPCKWKLKDISKMITHFTEMHGEHSVQERCKELGQALSQNRGPFEYWLRKTKSQNVGDGSIMDDVVEELLGGNMPALLRRLSRAAAGMPSE